MHLVQLSVRRLLTLKHSSTGKGGALLKSLSLMSRTRGCAQVEQVANSLPEASAATHTRWHEMAGGEQAEKETVPNSQEFLQMHMLLRCHYLL